MSRLNIYVLVVRCLCLIKVLWDCFILKTLETLDNGKPFLNAYNGDVSMATGVLRYNAGLADKIVGQTIPAGEYR